MRTHGISFNTTGAIAALAFALAACGGSESGGPSETTTAGSVASAPPDTNPVVDSVQAPEPEPEVVSTEGEATA